MQVLYPEVHLKIHAGKQKNIYLHIRQIYINTYSTETTIHKQWHIFK